MLNNVLLNVMNPRRYAVLILVFTPAVAFAQDAARLSGRVTSATGQPVVAAQVAIPTLHVGAQTNDQGQYTFTVPATSVHSQTVVISVRSLGHAPMSRQITLHSGTVSEDFVLQAASTTLEAVVVTGTPGATRVKELGNSIGTIDVEHELRDAPITTLQQLFQGREPGLQSISGTGEVGTANNIVLRGVNSLSQSNQPLIYVDGILINESNTALIAGTGGATTSRLNDLNVQDIARVEVIKGASATTLYGSQASGGVIQIFTKRGTGTGVPAEVTVHAEMGGSHMPSTLPYQNPNHKLPSANDLITTGLVQNYDLSVRGNANDVAYYTSVNYNQDNGSFPNNFLKKAGGRLNLTTGAGSPLTLDLSSQYLWSDTGLPVNGNTALGAILPILVGDPLKGTPANPNGALGYPVATLLRTKTDETYNRFIGGATANHVLTPSFHQRLTVGLDAANGTGTYFTPYGGAYLPLGNKTYTVTRPVLANADYAGTWTSTLRSGLKSTFSVGGQLNATHQSTELARGSNFAIPGFDALGGTSTQSVAEARVKFTTGGVFGQEELGFGDRLFLTGGVRVDGSTSFGESFGTQAYPKFGLAYVVSDEPWFRVPAVSSLKLRSAWGKAGKQPGAFDAVQTYVAIPTGSGLAGVVAANPGNPNLAPEISTEWEEGFDLGLWHDRVTFKATAYQQRTDQAILSQPSSGSSGFTSILTSTSTPTRFFANAGSLQNRGLELQLSWTAVDRKNIRWDWDASYAHNTSKVLNLNGLTSVTIDAFGTALQPGYPVSSKFAQVANGFDASGRSTYNGQVITAATLTQFIGPAVPPNNGSIGTQLHLGAFAVSSNLQWATGGYTTDESKYAQQVFVTGEDYYTVLAANGNNKSAPAVLGFLSRPLGNSIYKSDYLKLREVTVSYNLPMALMRGHATALYVSGRNLATWTKYPGTDPEANVTFGGNTGGTPGAGLSVGTEYATTPQPRYILVGTNISLSGGSH